MESNAAPRILNPWLRALKLIGLWPVYVFTGGTVRRLFVVQRQTFS
jgi:hypothetical protein